MGEKHSIDRLVGGSEQQRNYVQALAEHVFGDQRPLGSDVERPKTPEELQMIEIVNRETDRLRERYGLAEYRIPAENFHAIRKEKQEDVLGKNVLGSHDLDRQEIRFAEQDDRRRALKSLFHETVHFKSFASIDVADRHKRRLGLTTREGQDEMLFTPLNEAVTEELAKRFMRRQEEEPLLAKENELKRRVQKQVGDQQMEDIESLWIEGEEGRPGRKAILIPFSYKEERKALNLLIDKLVERNPKAYMKQEDWFDEFASAMFNGHLLQLARDIEETFGKGKFRELGEQKTGEDLMKFVESL